MFIIAEGRYYMEKEHLSLERKRADADLYMISISTIVILGIYMAFKSSIDTFAKNENVYILLRTFVSALVEFGVAGLGITIVCIYRKESFIGYGLNSKKVIRTILLSILVFVPNIIFEIVIGGATSYMPFQKVWITKEVISSAVPINFIGILLIAIAWGFFEGFNYVVITDKINTCFPSSNKWLDWGAIVCSIVCILIHGIIGVSFSSIIEMFTVFIIIYGMLMVRKFTGNAWGCVFIFVFLWNAF